MNRTVGVFVLVGLAVGLIVALAVSPFADSSPDGLEKVAAEEGFDGSARDHDLADSPLADYGVEGLDNDRIGTGLAGVVGVLATFGLGVGLFALLRVVRSPRSPRGSPADSSLA